MIPLGHGGGAPRIGDGAGDWEIHASALAIDEPEARPSAAVRHGLETISRSSGRRSDRASLARPWPTLPMKTVAGATSGPSS